MQLPDEAELSGSRIYRNFVQTQTDKKELHLSFLFCTFRILNLLVYIRDVVIFEVHYIFLYFKPIIECSHCSQNRQNLVDLKMVL